MKQQLFTTDEYTLRDPALTALLQETYDGDPALEDAPARTQRIMQVVRRQIGQQSAELADPAMRRLLQETYDGDPALRDTPARTATIMEAIRRQADPARELADPAMHRLLHEAFVGDPALVDAPGRAERIMRRILAIGGRWALFNWTPYAWASGAVAMAILAVVIGLGMVQAPMVAVKTPAPRVAPSPEVPPKIADLPRSVIPPEDLAPTPPVHRVHPVGRPEPTEETPSAPVAPHVPTPRKVQADVERPGPASTQREHPSTSPELLVAEYNPARAAGDLYTTGKAAHVVGDYETAYQAYQASYETVPTPEALMASGQALVELTQETPPAPAPDIEQM